MSSLTISDIGPIQSLSIPVPEQGGLVILHGASGTGKSTALEAIDVAMGRKGKLPIRDGSLKGSFSGHGVTMTIGRSQQRRGEADCLLLESRYGVEDIVDPGIEDPEKADAARVKALVSFTGIHPDPAMFYPLVGGKKTFDEIARPDTIASDDLLLMAARFKADLEAKSRDQAGWAANFRQNALASRKSAEGIDLDAPCDAKELQAGVESAVQIKTRLEQEDIAVRKAIETAEIGKKAIAKAKTEYDGPSVAQATEAEQRANAAVDMARLAEIEAKKAYDAAKSARETAERDATAAVLARRRAEQYQSTIATWTAQVEAAASAKRPNPGDIARAVFAVDQARRAVEDGAMIRRAKDLLADAERTEKQADARQAEADRFREAAHAVDQVLAETLQKSGIKLRLKAVNGQMRLVLPTDRGDELFADLSDGERASEAIQIAVKAVGRGGMITVAQRLFQDLQPAVRVDIARQLREGGVVGYAALVDDGPLTAEVFNGR